jgi:pimeloyl-ACP methyl ester carboxylesterase
MPSMRMPGGTTRAELMTVATRPGLARRGAQRRVLELLRRDRRVGVGVGGGVAALAAVLTSWWMPHGPMTTTHALAAMVIGASVGAAAGGAMRSRWAMLLTPVVYATVFEVARLGADGPSIDGVRPGSAGWGLALMLGRGLHGLVGLVPMLLGATFAAALTRRTSGERGTRHGRARIGVSVRRTVAVAATVGMIVLAVGIARPAGIEPFRDEKGDLVVGSLAEKIHVEINGLDQGMFIQSKSTQNPVLLFVHGGPGMPMFWLTRKYPTGLEEHFTVVWWEQRGAGLSYDPNIPAETMTADQFIADTLEVTRYLIERFGQEKIFLMGHSWGSYIGIQAVAKAPELYSAYIGVGQLTNQLESEQLAYDYALAYYEDLGDTRMVRKLKAAPPGTSIPVPANYDALRDEYMHRAGIGTTRDMTSVISGLFVPSWRAREYTFMEKVNLWRGKIYSKRPEFGLWDTMLATDLRKTIPVLEIPVYFLHGRFDYTCSYPLAKGYLEQLEAPTKGFYTFEGSAHSPMFEEPERTVDIMLTDVLNGTNSLADR